MSAKPLRTLGLVIDVMTGKAKDSLADWNKEVQDSLGVSENYADSTNDMAKEMFQYAKQTGLTKRQIREYKDILKKNEETDFAKRVNSQAAELKKLSEAAGNAKDKMSLLRGVMSGVAAVGLGSLAKSIGGEMIDLAKASEKTNLSFEMMLKNKQQAKEAVDMLNDFADTGAFSSNEALASGKRLLSLKMPVNEVKQALTDLGNIAAGSEMSLESLSDIYSKNKTLGIVQMNDIKQLESQHIPIIDELGKVLGVSAGSSEELAQKIKDMSSNGVIKFEHLRQAFGNMSKAGGEYAGTMDRMAKSATGLTSIFSNKLSSIKASLGLVLLEALKPFLYTGVKTLDWLQKSPVAMGILKTALLVLIPIIGVMLVAAFWSAATAARAMAAAVLAPLLPFIAIGAVILALILIIEDLYTFFIGGESVFGEWIEGFKGTLQGFWNTIKGWFNSILNLFKRYGKFLIMAIFPISVLYFYWNQISAFLGSLPDKIVDFFKSIPDKIKAALGDLKEGLKDMLPNWAVNLLAKINMNGQTESIEARAGGGSVSSGETYLVGEQGPELFTPSRSGTIIPNNALSGKGKSANITIAPTINISGASDPERVAALVMKKIQELIPSVSAELGLEV